MMSTVSTYNVHTHLEEREVKLEVCCCSINIQPVKYVIIKIVVFLELLKPSRAGLMVTADTLPGCVLQ